jgi:hypothetical protein
MLNKEVNINLKTKIAVVLILLMFASISMASAFKPQPHAMVWIVKSDINSNIYTLTYENFGYKSIGTISVAIINQGVTTTTGSGAPAIAGTSTSYPGWTTTQYSNQQISWVSSARADNRMSFDFSLLNCPCTLQYTIYDTSSKLLQSGTVAIQ